MTHRTAADPRLWWPDEPEPANGGLPPWLRRLLPALSLAALFAGYFALASVVMVHASDWTYPGGLKWDGIRYHGLINEFVEGGFSPAAVSGISAEGTPLGSAYVNRIGYFAVVGGVEALTGLSRLIVYRLVSVLVFAIAALGVSMLARRAGADAVSAAFAGAWLLLNPAAYIVFEIGTHPDPLALAFGAWALVAHASRRPYLAALLIFVGTLMKVSVAFLAPYVVIAILADATLPRGRRGVLVAAMVGAAAAGSLLPAVLVSSAGELDETLVWYQLFATMQTRALASLLYNFDVLWLVWGAALVQATRTERLQAASVCALLVLALFAIAIDWWRVPYGVLAVIVLPASAAFLSRRFHATVGAGGTWCVLAALTAVLLRLPARWEFANVEQYSFWPLAAVGVLLALNEAWLRARDQRSA